MAETTVAEVMAEPAALEDPKAREVNEKHGDGPDRLQWAMNHCLAQIGIEHAEHRARAIDIGERLEVLKGLPDSPELHISVRAHLDHRDGAPTARQVGFSAPTLVAVGRWTALRDRSWAARQVIAAKLII